MYGRGIELRVGRAQARAVMPDVIEHIGCGRLHPETIVSRRVSFDDAAEAMTDGSPKLLFVVEPKRKSDPWRAAPARKAGASAAGGLTLAVKKGQVHQGGPDPSRAHPAESDRSFNSPFARCVPDISYPSPCCLLRAPRFAATRTRKSLTLLSAALRPVGEKGRA